MPQELLLPSEQLPTRTVSEAPPAHDLRHALMTLAVPDQNRLLSEYKARRDNFRAWLMSQLIEGVHYGIVPGCEPKTKDINGVLHYGVYSKKANGGRGGWEWYPPSQWQPKPSLYAAGADFLCDILGVRDEYDTDNIGWQQMGSKAGTAVVKCRLISRATSELIGESLGAYSSQYDPNNALKMASKCAKVGAVINAYDLRDLFTQDEPANAPPHENPDADEDAPKAQPRAARPPKQKAQTEVSAEQLGHVSAEWKVNNPDPFGDVQRQREHFATWVKKMGAKRDFDCSKLSNWTLADYKACCASLGIPTVEELQ